MPRLHDTATPSLDLLPHAACASIAPMTAYLRNFLLIPDRLQERAKRYTTYEGLLHVPSSDFARLRQVNGRQVSR